MLDDTVIKGQPQNKGGNNTNRTLNMPSTRTTHSSHLPHPYPQPLTMYEYDDLTKNFDDAHEFLNAVDEKLKGDVDFLDHVLRTTRQMEDALANQRQVATNIFNRLVRHGFEQETRDLVHRLRRKRTHPPNPVPKVVRIQTPRPQDSRIARKTIPKPQTISTIPFPTRQDSLSDYHTPPQNPLGSLHNPILVDDDEEIPDDEELKVYWSCRNRRPTPAFHLTKESRRLGNRKLKAP